MNIQLRQEQAKDFEKVRLIVEAAFKNDPHSDQTEHLLVERLRKSSAFIPELSMVAELDGQIVGHILLTRIKIKNESHAFDSLALAPVSVHPDFQRQGIGGLLIRKAHEVARELGHGSVILLGHAQYYPRFGYLPTQQWNIRLPFEVPAENCMAIELKAGSLTGVSGTVEYDAAFFG